MEIRSFITWEDRLKIGIHLLDQQNKELIEIINHFYTSFILKKDKEELKSLLNKLTSFTVEHFKTEEKYFFLFNYPQRKEHEKEHRDLERQIVDFKIRMESGKLETTYHLMSFLNDWLTKHIIESDKKFAVSFRLNNMN